MTLLLKEPSATLDYSVDWGSDYLNGDALADSRWSVEPVEPGGVAVVSGGFDLLVAAVTVEGGVPGRIYRLTNHVTTAAGFEDARSIMLRVEKR
jgi:hypothetical protein